MEWLLELLLGKKRRVTPSEARKCDIPPGAMVRVKKSKDSMGRPCKTIRYRGQVHGRHIH